jgi:hypothetical protein
MFISRILTPYFFFCVTSAQTRSVSWAYPQKLDGNPSTVTINVVDTIVAEWTASFQPAYLWVWCNIGTTNAPNNDRCMIQIFPVRVVFSNSHVKGQTFLSQTIRAGHSAQMILGHTIKYKIGLDLSSAILISITKMHSTKISLDPIST